MDEGEAALAIGDALKEANMKAIALDTGEIFVEMPDGTKFALSVEEVEEFPIDDDIDIDDIDIDDIDDGTNGQNRKSYDDYQDRESYYIEDED